jgi:hypothetical protein
MIASSQELEEVLPVIISQENMLAAVAAPGNVVGVTRDKDSCHSRHQNSSKAERAFKTGERPLILISNLI